MDRSAWCSNTGRETISKIPIVAGGWQCLQGSVYSTVPWLKCEDVQACDDGVAVVVNVGELCAYAQC